MASLDHQIENQKFEFFTIETRSESRSLIAHFEDASSRNSLGLAAARELGAIFKMAENMGLLGLGLRARGSVFCSGGNLRDYAMSDVREAGIAVNREITSILNEISVSPLVTVAAVEGDCFGGGLELISAFDEVVATPGAMFGFWQRRIGLTCGWGGGHRLVRRLGEQRLVRLALEARGVFALEARDMGLVDSVILSSFIPDHLQKRLAAMSSVSQMPVAPLKKWRNHPSPVAESEMFEALWWNAEHQKALAPFRKN